MKTRATLFTLILCFAASICLANNQLGTWKLNESKSKFAADRARNNMVVYATEGDNVKITVDGIDSKGNATHNEWIGKFDGKDYPVTGDPNSDTRSYKQINDHTLEMTVKKGDKVVAKGTIAVSADGKTRTVTVQRTDSKNNESLSIAVYDKQ